MKLHYFSRGENNRKLPSFRALKILRVSKDFNPEVHLHQNDFSGEEGRETTHDVYREDRREKRDWRENSRDQRREWRASRASFFGLFFVVWISSLTHCLIRSTEDNHDDARKESWADGEWWSHCSPHHHHLLFYDKNRGHNKHSISWEKRDNRHECSLVSLLLNKTDERERERHSK